MQKGEANLDSPNHWSWHSLRYSEREFLSSLAGVFDSNFGSDLESSRFVQHSMIGPVPDCLEWHLGTQKLYLLLQLWRKKIVLEKKKKKKEKKVIKYPLGDNITAILSIGMGDT